MYNRWFNVAVVLLWLATMSWLIKEKVLPPLLVGDPPSYHSILEARRSEPPVGWRLLWNRSRVGWALSTIRREENRCTKIHSHVHLDSLPLSELAPGWLRTFFPILEPGPDDFRIEVQNLLIIDPLGDLSRIESSIEFEAFEGGITMEGDVHDTHLSLTIRSEGSQFRTEVPIDSQALLGDSLSPLTQLPDLREGQTWNVEVCSPLQYPNRHLEILQAKVERTEPILWDSELENVWVVVYRSNPGCGLKSDTRPRGQLWVRRDGTVLKQEVTIFSSTMTFIRMPDDKAAALAEAVGSRR